MGFLFFDTDECEEIGNLPAPWDVIYQEALRGHHLLFSPADWTELSRTRPGHGDWPSGEVEADLLAEALVELSYCADLAEIRAFVASMSLGAKRHLHSLYLRNLEAKAYGGIAAYSHKDGDV